MTTIQDIPLHELAPSKTNVRRTGPTQGVAELAASIKAHGLAKRGKSPGRNLFWLGATD